MRIPSASKLALLHKRVQYAETLHNRIYAINLASFQSITEEGAWISADAREQPE